MMNPYESPTTQSEVPDAMDKVPPVPIRRAVGCVMVSFVAGILNSIYLRFHGSGGNLNWAFGVGLALIVGFVYLWMRGLYRGKKWAYVLWMFSIASSLVFVSSMMRRFSALPTEWGKVLYVGQGILQLIATVMLVLPVSWRWFYRRPKQGL